MQVQCISLEFLEKSSLLWGTNGPRRCHRMEGPEQVGRPDSTPDEAAAGVQPEPPGQQAASSTASSVRPHSWLSAVHS